MSIVQLNIRTRIELETRVLAAALKQSFERGDSDGVSLAHRQLFLLLKDQKPGNGSSAATGEASTAQANGDTAGGEAESPRSEQQVYVPSAYSDPSEYSQYAATADGVVEQDSPYQEADYESSEQLAPHQLDVQYDETGEQVASQPHMVQGEYEYAEHESAEASDQESGYHESGSQESGSQEFGYQDSGSLESGYQESGSLESGYQDSGSLESGYQESGSLESGYQESGSQESGYKESGYQESGSQESGYQESGYQESGYQESGYQESGSQESGYQESGYQESGYQESGSQESGYQESGYPDAGGGGYQETAQVSPDYQATASQTFENQEAESYQSDEPTYQESNEVQDNVDVVDQEILETNIPVQGVEASQAPVDAAETGQTLSIPASEASFGRQTAEQAQAIAQYLKYKQTREMLASETDEQQDTDTSEQSVTLAAQAAEESKPLSEEEEYIRMRKAPAPKKEDLPFDQPSAEYAEIFGSTVIGEQPAAASLLSDLAIQPPSPFQNLSAVAQAGPFDSIPEPPSFIAQTPVPSSSETAAEAAAQVTENQEQLFTDTGDFAPAFQARNREMEFDSVSTEESDFAKSSDGHTDASSLPGDLPPELRQAPASPFPKISPITQNLTQDLPPVKQKTTQDLPQVSQNSTQDLPNVTPDRVLEDIRSQQAADYADRKASQSVPRNMPAIDFTRQSASNDVRTEASKPDIDFSSQSESSSRSDIDFSLQSESSSKPDIDFSLQSESSSKPDIDFSLQSESSSKPDIDFSLQSESSSKPDIDFSLQSESSNKPDIDFSLQSESSNKPDMPDIDFSLESEKHDGMLSAPTGGGFIDAEFVTSDNEPGIEGAPEPVVKAPATDEQRVTPASNHDLAISPPATHELAVTPLATHELTVSNTPTAENTVPSPFSPMPDAAATAASSPNIAPDAVPPAVQQQGPLLLTGVPLLASPRPPAPPETPVKSTTEETTSQEEPLVPAAPKPPDLYAMLGVSQMSPFEEIHKNFLRKIRKILLKLKTAVRPERDELLKELRRNWVARDILCDPVTRTDYDFRDMGLRGSPDAPAPHLEEPQRMGQRTPLRIGELLQCAGLLEQAELEIACDMHKAMPEVQFGTFLVRQGFIQERDLDSVLLGQTLLRDGKITVAQFQVAMELSQSRGANISDTLIEYGYITAAELSQLTGETAAAHEPQTPDTPVIKEVPVKPRQIEQPAQNLNTSSAIPTWKDQLDWSKPLPVDDDASLIDRSPDKQSLADLLGNVNTESAIEPDVVKISNNAAPSWKDQLDWNKPEEGETASDTASGAASFDSEEAAQQQQQNDESKPSLSIANAVPSWRDQLDWEQPKPEAQPPIEDNDAESEDDQEPIIHGSKETQPISIHPPTSIAPNIVLGKGNPRTAAGSGNTLPADEHNNPESSPQAAAEAKDAHDDEHSESHAEGSEDHDDEHPDDEGEGEGFFKRNLNKLKKGDSKDKKKKRK